MNPDLNKALTLSPAAKKVPFEITTHGDTRIDNYYWLRDMDRKDPEVIAHLEAENAYTKAVMKPTEKLQKELFEELKGRIKQEDVSVPNFYDGFYYYTRFETGKEYPIYCRKEGNLEADEQIMLDVNEMAKGFSYYQVASTNISTNNQLLAFSEDTLSRRIFTIRFKDLKTGEYLADKIEGTAGGCVWANDNETVFYVKKDEGTLRAHKVFRHKLGTSTDEDKEVFDETDVTFYTSIGKTKSKKWLMIHSSSTVSDEIRIIDANNPSSDWKVFQPRNRDIEYGVYHYNDYFYVLTNHKATNFRLMKTHETKTGIENWEEVIAHREDVLIEDIDVFSDYLVVSEKTKAQTALRIISWKTGSEHYIKLDEEVYHIITGINTDFNTHHLRFVYQSMTTPISVFDYDMETCNRKLLKEQEVLGGFDKKNYESHRLWVEARDGAQIPLSIVYRKETKVNEKTPLLLYGYGSYGITIDPYFSPSRLSLLDRGFVFVIAHIRGGQIMGRNWYDQGRMLKKMNSFNDFIDCAEFLIHNKYTGKEHLYAMGGSAGGLLMGAIINMRPDLWNGVAAVVPFVDVVTTMLDDSIPLTTGEYDEWGNPNDKIYYDYIKAYSPYDNVGKHDYPNLLVTTGLHDSQVQYWEPAKWVAKLREHRTNDNLLLLQTNMEFGHSGASGRFEAFKEVAFEYAFFIHLENQND